MKTLVLLLTLTFSNTIIAQDVLMSGQLDGKIPSVDLLVTQLRSDMVSYFRRMHDESEIREVSKNCRELRHYKNFGARTKFLLCIERTISENEVIEIVEYTARGDRKGHLVIKRKGPNLKSTKNDNLFNFMIPTISEGQEIEWKVEGIGPTVRITKSNDRDLGWFSFPHANFKFNIEERRFVSSQIRTMSISCDFCETNELKVLAKKSMNGWVGIEVEYYIASEASKVSPKRFMDLVAKSIFRPLGQVTSSLKSGFMNQWGFPTF